MLTDEQLRKAAWYLCEGHHLNPEAYNPLQKAFEGPGWKTYAETFEHDIREHDLLHEAMGLAIKAEHLAKVAGQVGVALEDSTPIPDDPDGHHTVKVRLDSGE